jgi:hypothetical protein
LRTAPRAGAQIRAPHQLVRPPPPGTMGGGDAKVAGRVATWRFQIWNDAGEVPNRAGVGMTVQHNRRVMIGLWTAAGLAALAAGAPAMADPLPPSVAIYTLSQPFNGQNDLTNVQLPVGYYQHDSDGFGDDISGFTSPNNFGAGPMADITAIAGGSGSISLKYYYEITGPGGSAQIDLSGSAYAFGFPYPDQGGAWAGIWGSAGLPAGGFYGQACASFSNGCAADAPFGTVPVNVQFTVPTNTLEWIELGVSASAGGFGSEFVAQADPIISLDPSIGDPQDYQILVSPDVQNGDPPVIGGGVPEPATWAMMLVGFGGLGALLRRRRRGQVALAA